LVQIKTFGSNASGHKCKKAQSLPLRLELIWEEIRD